MHFSELFSFCPVCGSNTFTLNNQKSKRCDKCGFIMYVNASAAVAAFIVNEQGELLTCLRGNEPVKGTLDLPGGFIDDNETAEQALTRELMEELNAEVTDMKYLFSLPNDYLYSGWTIPTIDIFFEVTIEDFRVLKPADDVAGLQFIPVRELKHELFGLNSIKKAIKRFRSISSDTE